MGERNTYWLGFSHVPGVGSVRIKQLLDAFGTLELAWKATRTDLRRAGMGPKTTDSILRVRSSLDLDRAQSKLERLGIELVTLLSPKYPEPLKHITSPPACLFVKGSWVQDDRESVAVVGTRQASKYGKLVTESLVQSLAERGLTIISGLAKGIDGLAHWAALNAGGRTIAVLGSGLDEIYPAEHRRLANSIGEQGALFSEYPPGKRPEGHHFPARNRIIAGLAKGVIVIEAAERSGALITAGFAADQGKEVFAVPGDVTRKTSRGTNRLIQDGATPILQMDDVLDGLHLFASPATAGVAVKGPEDATQTQILKALENEPAHIDTLYQMTGLPIQEIQAALALLELSGSVKHLGGMHYQRLGEEPIEYIVD